MIFLTVKMHLASAILQCPKSGLAILMTHIIVTILRIFIIRLQYTTVYNFAGTLKITDHLLDMLRNSNAFRSFCIFFRSRAFMRKGYFRSLIFNNAFTFFHKKHFAYDHREKKFQRKNQNFLNSHHKEIRYDFSAIQKLTGFEGQKNMNPFYHIKCQNGNNVQTSNNEQNMYVITNPAINSIIRQGLQKHITKRRNAFLFNFLFKLKFQYVTFKCQSICLHLYLIGRILKHRNLCCN